MQYLTYYALTAMPLLLSSYLLTPARAYRHAMRDSLTCACQHQHSAVGPLQAWYYFRPVVGRPLVVLSDPRIMHGP